MATRPARPRFRRCRAAERPRFVLTEGDVDLLAAIGRHGVLTSEQLERVFPDRSAQVLRRRLQYLFHGGYAARPRSQIQVPAHLEPGAGRPMFYTLARKGAALLAQKRGLSLRGYAADATLGSLQHERLVSEFCLRFEQSCAPSRCLIYPDDLLRVAPAHRDRAGVRWKVKPLWKGSVRTLYVRPDRIFAAVDLSLPEEKAGKFCFLEVDRGTRPLERRHLSQTSNFRKFLAYSESYKTRKHKECFGFPNMRVLFVAKSPARVEGMRLLFQKHTYDLCSQKLFLFTDWPTVQATNDLFDLPWLLPDGSTVRLFD